jgi:hypothetical protein
MDLALLVIRVVVGRLFVSHGAVAGGRMGQGRDEHDAPPHPA